MLIVSLRKVRRATASPNTNQGSVINAWQYIHDSQCNRNRIVISSQYMHEEKQVLRQYLYRTPRCLPQYDRLFSFRAFLFFSFLFFCYLNRYCLRSPSCLYPVLRSPSPMSSKITKVDKIVIQPRHNLVRPKSGSLPPSRTLSRALRE